MNEEKTEKKENVMVDKFLVHLLDCNDTDNLIIKGHILTEHALHFFIEMNSIEKLNFKKIKFTYSNKIEIAKILGLYKENPELYNELKLLNRLRNSIAHNLKYDQKTLNDFLLGFDKYKGFFQSEKFKRLSSDEEIFYENNGGKITVKGEHMILMFYISSICMSIFGSYKPKKEK
jgi:hypothetical protein